MQQDATLQRHDVRKGEGDAVLGVPINGEDMKILGYLVLTVILFGGMAYVAMVARMMYLIAKDDRNDPSRPEHME